MGFCGFYVGGVVAAEIGVVAAEKLLLTGPTVVLPSRISLTVASQCDQSYEADVPSTKIQMLAKMRVATMAVTIACTVT